jgi:hypothetical protein
VNQFTFYCILNTIMRLCQLLASVLAFSQADAYLVTPPGTVAPGAISTCSEWVQASYGMTCDIIHRLFGMTDAEFELWVSRMPASLAVVFLSTCTELSRILVLLSLVMAAI